MGQKLQMTAIWSRALLEKLILDQLVKKFPSFMEPKSCLLGPITGLYLSLVHVHTHAYNLFKIYLLLLFAWLQLGIPNDFFSSLFINKSFVTYKIYVSENGNASQKHL
jgi:hypothetical protein